MMSPTFSRALAHHMPLHLASPRREKAVFDSGETGTTPPRLLPKIQPNRATGQSAARLRTCENTVSDVLDWRHGGRLIEITVCRALAGMPIDRDLETQERAG